MTRLFFAVNLPLSIKQQLAFLQSVLQDKGFTAHNWTSPLLFHVTLVFLGEQEDSLRPFLMQVSREVAGMHTPFTMNLSSLDAFSKKRVLWVGLAPNEGLLRLQGLQSALTQSLAKRFPLEREQQPYCPHITLARQSARDCIHHLDDYHSLARKILTESEFPVSSFCLFASTRLEGQLAYPVLAQFPLVKSL
ncbi:RNA 2',3'-cyclic phosphodiesterase [Alicyclobacillaceae bacterium I2511]|nr:RNA 2',3'-cyclic phosphodiesterase [Alicyclobacillaceae bacterium I2511]